MRTTLAEAHPELAALWHSTKNGTVTPHDVTKASGKKYWWECPEPGHEWEANIGNQSKKPRCPYCAGTKVLAGYNDLSTLFPEVARQFIAEKNLGVDLLSLSRKNTKKLWWRCDEGHEWEAYVFNRTTGRGCPFCSGRRVKTGVTDLATLAPEIAAEWHPTKNDDLLPSQVTAGSHHKAWWQCKVDSQHEWQAEVGSRARNGNGCPICGRRVFRSGINDLLTNHPDVAMEWHPTKNGEMTPSQVGQGTETVVWWQCSVEPRHEWEAPVTRRTRVGRKSGCPYCASKQVDVGFNDLASQRPLIAAEWHPTLNGDLQPTDVTYGSRKRAWWQCGEGHEWETKISGRTRGAGTQCDDCRPAEYTSQGERDIQAFVEALGFEVVMNSRRQITGVLMELDVYIPEKKFAIEFNGVYWHSETYRGREYHAGKQKVCSDAGVTLYQVWEDDWADRKDVVLRGIAHRLGVTGDDLHKVLPHLPAFFTERVGARKTSVVTVTYQEAAAFLELHHIQGGCTGTHYLGLRDQEERLRAVLVLKSTGRTGELSIERFATAGVVPGGFTKLLRHVEREFMPSRWITFADLSVSEGALYDQNGFTVDKLLKPDYSYLVGNKRVHKFNYRLKRFRDDPALEFEKGLSERQLAKLNGLVRIWDSGKRRYMREVASS